jgi:hypothetical protein
MMDLPELPEGYRVSAPFRRSAETSPIGAPPPPDVPAAVEYEELQEVAAPAPASRRRPSKPRK